VLFYRSEYTGLTVNGISKNGIQIAAFTVAAYTRRQQTGAVTYITGVIKIQP